MRTLLLVERGTITHFAKWVALFLVLAAIVWQLLVMLTPSSPAITSGGPIAGCMLLTR